MNDITLRQWLLNYPLNQGSQSSQEWSNEYDRFKKALRAYWKTQGVVPQW